MIGYTPIIPLEFDASISYMERIRLLCKKLNITSSQLNDIAKEFGEFEEEFNNWKTETQRNVLAYLEELKNNGYIAEQIENVVNQSKKYLLVGDSYIKGYAVQEPIRVSYAQRLIALTGINAEILGESGAGFCNRGDETSSRFLDLVSNYTGDKNAITDIYVMGGYNDRTYTDFDIYTAMSNFSTYVKNNYPNAHITVGFISWSQIGQDYTSLNNTMTCYSRCGTYGMGYMTNIENVMHNSNYFANDQFHPNDEGHTALAVHMASYVLGGGIDVVQPYSQITVPAVNNVQLGNMWASQKNDITTISMRDSCNIVLSAYDSMYWGTQWVQLSGRVPIRMANGYWQAYQNVSVLWNEHNTNNWYVAPATIKLVNGEFNIQILALNPNGQGLYNGQIDQCIIPAFTMTMTTVTA